ncbi:MAG: hypothetical protein WBB27_03460 [Maribacter sp.]
MKQEISKNISTENGTNEFQIRLFQDEGVGLLTAKNEENYLILDSIDYWYDLIQNEYPKKKKCSCKNEWFYVAFNYVPREGTEDIREIIIVTTCTVCNKISKPISIDIKYSPTKTLIENPITFCERPNIKYKIKQLTSYWSGNNLKDFLQFIFLNLNLNGYCWFWLDSEKKRRFEKVSLERALQISDKIYLAFYFSANELDTKNYLELTDDKGVYLKEEIWRRDETIEMRAPLEITDYGLLYYIKYCNQYLDKGNVKDKSEKFEKTTNQLQVWLKEKFITKRGTNCFDGQEAFTNIYGKKKYIYIVCARAKAALLK